MLTWCRYHKQPGWMADPRGSLVQRAARKSCRERLWTCEWRFHERSLLMCEIYACFSVPVSMSVSVLVSTSVLVSASASVSVCVLMYMFVSGSVFVYLICI